MGEQAWRGPRSGPRSVMTQLPHHCRYPPVAGWGRPYRDVLLSRRRPRCRVAGREVCALARGVPHASHGGLTAVGLVETTDIIYIV